MGTIPYMERIGLTEQDLSGSISTVDRAELLIDAVQRFSAANTLQEIIDLATRLARKGSGADGASFVLREQDQCFYVNEDAIGPLWKGRRFPMSACVSGWVMHHRLPVVISDITLDERVPQDAYLSTFVRSLVIVPIRSMDPIGAIGAYWSTVGTPPLGTAHWLQALADAASAGIGAVRAKVESEEVARRLNAASPSSDPVRMCAWTKRIWYGGEWLSFEAYLRAKYGAAVTHGMSPEARQTLLDELK